MNDVLLNINQVLQLAALGPCVAIIIYLLFSSTNYSLIVLPLLFFLSVGLHFLLPVLTLFPETDKQFLNWLFLLNRNLEPPLGFLLILQFIFLRVPGFAYWLIFAIPFIGGGPLLYTSYTNAELCLENGECFAAEYFLTLYRIFGGALIFLLLIPILHRTNVKQKKGAVHTHKYWLIITLVFFNLLLIGVDLVYITQLLSAKKYVLIQNVLMCGFVYLVLSSVFRVFSESMGIRSYNSTEKSQKRDRKVADKIRHLIENEKPYCELEFSRKALAEQLNEKEHVISRAINAHFGKSFSELMNSYRINDAKEKLLHSKEAVTVIAYDTGFKSITSFNRVFKEATGLSPTEFRKNDGKTA